MRLSQMVRAVFRRYGCVGAGVSLQTCRDWEKARAVPYAGS